MNHGIQSTPYALTGPRSNGHIPSAPPLQAMDFSTPSPASAFRLATARLDQPLPEAATTVAPTKEDAAPVVVHQSAQPQSAQDRRQSGPSFQASDFELSSTDLILLQAQQPVAGGASPHGSGSCLDFLARCTGALLRECGTLLRSVDGRCADLSARAPQCNGESLIQVGHDVGMALGRCGQGGIDLCTSILKCPVTTCSAVCNSLDRMTCPSCPSCPDNCDCNCCCCCCGEGCDGCDNCC